MGGLLVPLFNVVAGFWLAYSLLGKIPNMGKSLQKAGKWFDQYENSISITAFVLAILNLVERWLLPIPLFNGSYPQSISAFLIGISTSDKLFKNVPQVQTIAKTLSEYREWIGMGAMAAGLLAIF